MSECINIKLEENTIRSDFSKISKQAYEEYHKGRYEHAKDMHIHALDLAEKLKDDNLVCKANTNIGNCCGRIGKYEEAIFYHKKAEIIAMTQYKKLETEKKSDLHEEDAIIELPGIKNHIGMIYLQKGLYLDAKKEFEDGLNLTKELLKLKNLQPRASAQLKNAAIRLKSSIIDNLQFKNDLHDIKEQYRLLIESLESEYEDKHESDYIFSRNNKRSLANLYIKLGSLLIIEKEINKAQELITKGKLLGNELKDYEIIRFAIFKKSQIAYLESNEEKALDLLNDPLFLSRDMGGLTENRNHLIDFYLFRAELLVHKNDYKQTLESLFIAQKLMDINDYYTDTVKLFVYLTKFASEGNSIEISKDLISQLQKLIHNKNRDVLWSNSAISDPNRYLANFCNDIQKMIINSSINNNYQIKIAEIYNQYALIFNSLNIIPLKFKFREENEYLNIFINFSKLFASTKEFLPNTYEYFRENWYNKYKSNYFHISDLSLELLIVIKYNDDNLKRHDDCLIQFFTILEIELFRLFINPIKSRFLMKTYPFNKDYDLMDDFSQKKNFFFEFIEYLSTQDVDHDIRFIVIERFLEYLDETRDSDKWVKYWKVFIEDVKKLLLPQHITCLKHISSFLDKNWHTSNGNMNFRQIRNNIIHPTKGILTRKELEDLYIKIKKEMLGTDEKFNDTNSILKQMICLSNLEDLLKIRK